MTAPDHIARQNTKTKTNEKHNYNKRNKTKTNKQINKKQTETRNQKQRNKNSTLYFSLADINYFIPLQDTKIEELQKRSNQWHSQGGQLSPLTKTTPILAPKQI